MNKIIESLLKPWLAQAWDYGYNTARFDEGLEYNDQSPNPYRGEDE